jgi:RNA polymerase sigma-70 factor (ECF subfamily)
MQDEDKFLVELFQQGDDTAFDELVRKYQHKIYQLAYHFTHNVEDALDLSQEIFFRVFKSFSDFRQQSSFYTWLYRISQNLGIDYTRRQKRGLKTVAMTEYNSTEYISSNVAHDSPSKLVEAKELEREITQAIDMLPARQKSAFILWYYDGLDLKSIADILGCQVGTVKTHLSYARRKLKKMLSPFLST